MMNWLKKHNIVFWVLALLVSCLLWLYVQVNLDPETEREFSGIRPRFEGADTLLNERDIQITGGTDVTVSVRLRGRRTDLAQCTSENIDVVVNLTDITNPGVSRLVYDVRPPVEGVNEVWRSVNYITITSDKIIPGTVNVRVVGNISVAPNFNLENTHVEPSQIRVRGPSELLSTISYAQVSPNKTDLDRTEVLKLPVTFIDHDGNEIDSELLQPDVSDVTLTLEVSMTKDVPLEAEVIDGGGATLRNAIVKVEPETIRLSGDPTTLETINKIVVATVDLAVTPSGTTRNSVPISIPNDVKNVSGDVVASVTVEITGLYSQRFDAENISVLNAKPPDGYELRLVTQSLPVMVRGPQATVELLSAHNIRVVADLADKELVIGQQTVIASVFIDGYTDVGAVGEYKVVLDVVRIGSP